MIFYVDHMNCYVIKSCFTTQFIELKNFPQFGLHPNKPAATHGCIVWWWYSGAEIKHG